MPYSLIAITIINLDIVRKYPLKRRDTLKLRLEELIDQCMFIIIRQIIIDDIPTSIQFIQSTNFDIRIPDLMRDEYLSIEHLEKAFGHDAIGCKISPFVLDIGVDERDY